MSVFQINFHSLRNNYSHINSEKKSLLLLNNFCQPILKSHLLKRLKSITFLGILSPKFKSFTSYSKLNHTHILDDGTRRDHSIGVALIILKIAQRLDLRDETLKYAACWGLLHDIATWPLSHTGEAAFSAILKISSKDLRKMMIKGASNLPINYTINRELESIGVDPKKLLMLFDKENKLKDPELQKIWQIIHSPITPDTLEGMWRSGKVFNINIPSPFYFENKIKSDLFDAYIKKSDSIDFIQFWRKKSKLYEKYINNYNTILLESLWSNSIINYFDTLDLVESLEISESKIVKYIQRNGLVNSSKVKKYKTPQTYYIKKNTRKLNDISILKLHHFLLRKKKYELLYRISKTH